MHNMFICLHQLQIYGSTSMCVDVCSNGNNFCRGYVVIDVNVTDFTSETTVQCEGQTRVPIRYRPYKLTIIDDDRSFHPCHSTVVKVNVHKYKRFLLDNRCITRLGGCFNCVWKPESSKCKLSGLLGCKEQSIMQSKQTTCIGTSISTYRPQRHSDLLCLYAL